MSRTPVYAGNEVGLGYVMGKMQQSGNASPLHVDGKPLREWVEYALRMERALKEQKEETFGQAGIKAAALKEIARLDPNNPLLKQEVRNDIFEKAVEEAKNDGKLD